MEGSESETIAKAQKYSLVWELTIVEFNQFEEIVDVENNLE